MGGTDTLGGRGEEAVLRDSESGNEGAGSWNDILCRAEPEGDTGIKFGSKGISAKSPARNAKRLETTSARAGGNSLISCPSEVPVVELGT